MTDFLVRVIASSKTQFRLFLKISTFWYTALRKKLIFAFRFWDLKGWISIWQLDVKRCIIPKVLCSSNVMIFLREIDVLQFLLCGFWFHIKILYSHIKCCFQERLKKSTLFSFSLSRVFQKKQCKLRFFRNACEKPISKFNLPLCIWWPL